MPDAVIKTIMAELKAVLETIYGPRLKKLILFGSHARGDARPDSDVDFLAVLDGNFGEVDLCLEKSRISERVYELSLKYEKTIAVIPVSEDRYNNSRLMYLSNAREEGIAA
ncbi:MAG TPA: nucleotidyltransferase domain-containing protein [Candidatus Wallbacteria bacterium]|nr:nucleotidyltransferase domain-containing protein [Candidatus Wallbacteria bacterium]